MGVEITCPNCGCVGRVKAQPAPGTRMKCRRCGLMFRAGEELSTPAAVAKPDVDLGGLVDFDAPPASKSPANPNAPHGSLYGMQVEKRPLFRISDHVPSWYAQLWILIAAVACVAGVANKDLSWTFAILGIAGVVSIPFTVMGLVGAYIAKQKYRDESEGFTFGFLLSPLGWILEALLPTMPPTDR